MIYLWSSDGRFDIFFLSLSVPRVYREFHSSGCASRKPIHPSSLVHLSAVVVCVDRLVAADENGNCAQLLLPNFWVRVILGMNERCARGRQSGMAVCRSRR